jgi:hypothetical protein
LWSFTTIPKRYIDVPDHHIVKGTPLKILVAKKDKHGRLRITPHNREGVSTVVVPKENNISPVSRISRH